MKQAIQIQDPTLDLAGVVAFGDRDKGMVAAADRKLGMMSGFHDLKHASSNIALAVKGCGLAVRMKFETAASMYTKEEAWPHGGNQVCLPGQPTSQWGQQCGNLT